LDVPHFFVFQLKTVQTKGTYRQAKERTDGRVRQAMRPMMAE